MRWSIEELLQALAIYKEYTVIRKVIRFPRNTYKRLGVFVKWIFTGYTDLSIWSLDTFLTDIIIYRLKKFRSMKRIGYPSIMGQDKWGNILSETIDKWEKMRDDYYTSQFEYPEPLYHKIEVEGRQVTAFNTNLTPEQEEERQDLYTRQAKNNKEAFRLFSENFNDFWD